MDRVDRRIPENELRSHSLSPSAPARTQIENRSEEKKLGGSKMAKKNPEQAKVVVELSLPNPPKKKKAIDVEKQINRKKKPLNGDTPSLKPYS